MKTNNNGTTRYALSHKWAKGWDKTHLIGGVFQTLVGLALLYVAMGYEFGSSLQMGPGYFPTILSILFVMLGLATIAAGRQKDPDETHDEPLISNWRPPLFILGSILVFMLLVERIGFVVTIFAVTALARFADRKVGWRSTIIVAAVTTLINVVIFIILLRMPFKAFW